jgi:hypothetical protein
VVGDNNNNIDDDAAMFLAPFAALNAFGMIMSAYWPVG